MDLFNDPKWWIPIINAKYSKTNHPFDDNDEYAPVYECLHDDVSLELSIKWSTECRAYRLEAIEIDWKGRSNFNKVCYEIHWRNIETKGRYEQPKNWQ